MKKFLVLCFLCFLGNLSSTENIKRKFYPDYNETAYFLIDSNKKEAVVTKGDLGYTSSFDPAWRFKEMDFDKYIKWLGVSDEELYNLVEEKYNTPKVRSCLKVEKN